MPPTAKLVLVVGVCLALHHFPRPPIPTSIDEIHCELELVLHHNALSSLGSGLWMARPTPGFTAMVLMGTVGDIAVGNGHCTMCGLGGLLGC